ncbi:hypothetical protein [Kitasatospora azatica]|uniref:hypothetical protein n=1 Tax=Kitasatospora azatica TaxID=58347 RepID=UPI0005694058|nr:hypothetical protein [Kitasatospora azatica]
MIAVKRFGWALVLLALAFPAAARTALAALAVAGSVIEAHPRAVCAAAGVLLAVSAARAVSRRVARSRRRRQVRRLVRAGRLFNPSRLAPEGVR